MKKINKKIILITGSKGQLGRALNIILDKEKYEIINTDYLEDCFLKLDITNENQVNQLVDSINPDIIINAAAYTAVDLAESEEELAYRINAIGPKNLANIAERLGATLVHVSTDYVFDGNATEPIKVNSKTNPTSVYGKTKACGEEFVKENCSKYFIVRTAWLYGEGKNFVKTMLELAKTKDEIRVVSDQFGCPTSALELARMIAKLIEKDNYGIYHGVCSGSCSWYEFAKMIFELSKIDIKVTPIKGSEYPTSAKRPNYSVLDNSDLLKLGINIQKWESALKEYLGK